jgi:polysaccharide export outer membrane protein
MVSSMNRLDSLWLAAALALGLGVAPASAQQAGVTHRAAAGAAGAETPAGSRTAPPPASAQAGSNSSSPASANATGAASDDPEYEIGPGDVLAIDVWKEPEISRALPVRPDGRLTLPLAGELKAQGLTTEQLAAEITERLTKYIDHPAVTVMVQDAQSRRYNILEMVNHPGSFALNQPTTVLDAIAQAGGLRDFAHPAKIYVIRKVDGVEWRYPFNYDDVSRGLRPEENILLKPNDIVVVP